MSEKETAPKAAPGRRRGMVLAIVGLLILAIAGGAAWFFLTSRTDATDAAQPGKPSVFLPLEQFTVNLADEGGERMAQIAITLELASQEVESGLKARMPALRNAILLEISSMHARDLLSIAGKTRLASRVAVIGGMQAGWTPDAASAAAGAQAQPGNPSRPNPVRAVHFSHFIVQ